MAQPGDVSVYWRFLINVSWCGSHIGDAYSIDGLINVRYAVAFNDDLQYPKVLHRNASEHADFPIVVLLWLAHCRSWLTIRNFLLPPNDGCAWCVHGVGCLLWFTSAGDLHDRTFSKIEAHQLPVLLFFPEL